MASSSVPDDAGMHHLAGYPWQVAPQQNLLSSCRSAGRITSPDVKILLHFDIAVNLNCSSKYFVSNSFGV